METFFLTEDLLFWSSPNFGPKTGLNLSEDLFFFWSSPNFGQKNGLGFGLENFHSGFHYFQIFWLPPFENPAYTTDYAHKKAI